MAIVDKKRIQDTENEYVMSTVTDTGDDVFDTKLSLTIPGHVIAGGRPFFKVNQKTGNVHAFTPHKEAMRKLFKPIFLKDKNLQYLMLDKVAKVEMRVYYHPTKVFRKHMSLEDITSELFYSITKKDNDNVEKVHWDILADWHYKVILDDNLIVENTTKKFMSMDERIEIDVIFCSDNSKLHKAYDISIREGLTYPLVMLNPKFLFKEGIIQSEELFNAFVVTVREVFKLQKKKSFKKELKKTLDSTNIPKQLIARLTYVLNEKDISKMKKGDMIDYYADTIVKYGIADMDKRWTDRAKYIIEGGLSNEYIKKCRESN